MTVIASVAECATNFPGGRADGNFHRHRQRICNFRLWPLLPHLFTSHDISNQVPPAASVYNSGFVDNHSSSSMLTIMYCIFQAALSRHSPTTTSCWINRSRPGIASVNLNLGHHDKQSRGPSPSSLPVSFRSKTRRGEIRSPGEESHHPMYHLSTFLRATRGFRVAGTYTEPTTDD